MRVIKVLCHNAALVENKEGRKGIVTGPGIAFGKKQGDLVDEDKIEMLYIEYNSRVQEIVRAHL
jgi:hypothetical protein